MIESTTTLPDGRTLAFAEFGDPDGQPCCYFHGAPGCRWELSVSEAAAVQAGVRLIAADRPGYGGSAPAPDRTIASWADDVAALADHLGLDRFGVAGLSSGGPYTVATAALLGDRVTGAVVAAGSADTAWPASADGYLDREIELMALATPDDAVRRCEEHYGVDGSGFLGGDLDLGSADSAFLADERHLGALMAELGEAFRQGVVGYAHDIWVQGRPWTFDPASIVCPVLVVHGDDDDLVPLAHSEHTASTIPGSELRVLPGVGHLSMVTELPALLAETVTCGV